MYQVIVVDDESFVLEDLKKAIDWFGFNMEIVLAATNPLDALTFLKEHPVHLLITDISMPEMTGVELIREAKKVNPSISILVLSAYDTFAYVRSAMQSGAENYLLKPLDPDELTASISLIVKHLDDRQKIAENYGPAMLTFRNNFVENWCKGNLSDDELITRASMLGVNLQLDNYTVVMFSADARDAGKLPILFDSLLSVFVGKYTCHFYFGSPSCFVCILSTSGMFNVFQFKSQIDKLRPTLGFSFFVCVGNTVDNYDDVSSSYYEIEKYSLLQYSPLPFIVCGDLRPSLQYQQVIEKEFSETSQEDYIQGIQAILKEASPKRRSFIQLAVVNWGMTQLSTTPSAASAKALLKDIVCDCENPDCIADYLRSFCSTIRKLQEDFDTRQDASCQYIRMVTEAVHDFSNKDISLKTLAAQLDMHPSYLGYMFHQQTGLYFNDYLNEERIKYAAKLMEDRQIKLKDIAEMVGFSSQTYFNRQFKKRFDASPNAYRRNLKLKNP